MLVHFHVIVVNGYYPVRQARELSVKLWLPHAYLSGIKIIQNFESNFVIENPATHIYQIQLVISTEMRQLYTNTTWKTSLTKMITKTFI